MSTNCMSTPASNGCLRVQSCQSADSALLYGGGPHTQKMLPTSKSGHILSSRGPCKTGTAAAHNLWTAVSQRTACPTHKPSHSQIHALLPDLGHVSGGQHFQIRRQGAGCKRFHIARLVPWCAQQHVVAQRAVQNPGILRANGQEECITEQNTTVVLQQTITVSPLEQWVHCNPIN